MRRLFPILLAALVLFPGCSARDEKLTASWYDLFDTVSSLTCYNTDEETFERYRDRAYEILRSYHEALDIDHAYGNNLYTVNQNAGIRPVPVSNSLYACLAWGKEACDTTGGRVNIAMGSVLSIWRRYREEGLANPEQARLPKEEELRTASRHTSIDNLVLDDTAQTAYLSDPEASVDFGALAKGYAADRTAEALRAMGCTDALLNLGGNVICIGPSEALSRETFSIGIADPENEKALAATLHVRAESVVTSGDYQRYYTVAGKPYAHIIDPDTLYPADSYHSVTVVCESSAAADMLSTALFLLPLEEGKALASACSAEAFWIAEDGSRFETDGFASYTRASTR